MRAESRSRCCFVVLLLGAFWCFPQRGVRAGDDIFVWVDDDGKLHASDNLDLVPEPYYSTYRARLDEREKAAANAPKKPPARPPSHRSVARPRRQSRRHTPGAWIDEYDKKRRYWRDQVVAARNALTESVVALLQAEHRLDELRMNPILAQTPVVRAQIAEQLLEVEKARQGALAARKHLLVELPAEARKQNVPPAWLQ